jgi:hypothetical protein
VDADVLGECLLGEASLFAGGGKPGGEVDGDP